jgi:transcriptional regulator with XRE-family HTH domain
VTDPSRSSRRARFAANVERLRQGSGLSLDQLASRSQIDRAELDAILSGEDEAQIEMIYLLAGALSVEPGLLLEGVEWIPGHDGAGEYRVRDPDGD